MDLSSNFTSTGGFQRYGDHRAAVGRELFEALDHDTSATAEYFREKCSAVPPELIITLRDTRPGNYCRTLLHNATRNGNLAAVLFLMRLGHPVDIKDSTVGGMTPLHEAIEAQQLEVAIVLLEAGASLSLTDSNGDTALHCIARHANCRALRQLVTHSGLSTDEIRLVARQVNAKNRTAAQVAKDDLMREILENFARHGQCAPVFAKRKGRLNGGASGSLHPPVSALSPSPSINQSISSSLLSDVEAV